MYSGSVLLQLGGVFAAGVLAVWPSALFGADERAQADPPRAVEREPEDRPSRPLLLSGFLTLLEDHKAIWTSPARVNGQSLPWLLPFAGATVASISIFDRRIAGALPNTSDQIAVSRAISQAATHYALGGLVGSFYLGGKLAASSRARETGLIAAQAVLHTHAVVQMLKFAGGRERPDYAGGEGRFWRGQQSFPSGHSAGAWAAATVISREYQDNVWLRYGVYVFPVIVGAARIGASRHFVSDVAAGALIGRLIGSCIYDRRHDPALGGAPVRTRPRALPMPQAGYNPMLQGYQLSLRWQM